MSLFIDITGNKYGKLLVLGESLPRKSNTRWVCQCDCGTIKVVRGSSIKGGSTVSCGCYGKNLHITHGCAIGGNTGGVVDRIYATWANMKARCSNPNHDYYKHYGGRGISVCQEWLEFIPFQQWAIQNGYSDDLQIDRIDNDKGYSPENCRFVTPSINVRNRRPLRGTSSKYIGVHFRKVDSKWVARIDTGNCPIYIGKFDTELEAAIARDSYVTNNNLIGFPLNIKQVTQNENTKEPQTCIANPCMAG